MGMYLLGLAGICVCFYIIINERNRKIERLNWDKRAVNEGIKKVEDYLDYIEKEFVNSALMNEEFRGALLGRTRMLVKRIRILGCIIE